MTGCIENIKRKLGYRLQLVSGHFRTEAQAGQAILLSLEFQNVGYAAPFNPRGLELVLRHTVIGEEFYAALSRDTDVRRWLPGTNHVLTAQLSLPSDLPLGSYELLLNLPDPTPTLYGLIPYSVRLANSNALSSVGTVLGDVWEPATGYHNLHQTLNINATATNSLPNGTEINVLKFSAVAETYETWKARNFPSNPGAGVPDGNPDADDRLNLIEYAVGSNPNSAQDPSYLDVSFDTSAFFLSVRKGPGAANDVRYEVEGSPGLVPGSWSSSLVTILENNAASIRARYDGTTTNGFLRLKFALVQ